jgi:hypothetical protein
MKHTEYGGKYPRYCKSCKGWGLFITASPDIYFWECECVKQRQCPRCGSEKALDEMYKCVKCGWDVCDSDRGLPSGARMGESNWIKYGEPESE